MAEVFLTLHVLAAVLAIGPIAVAGSLFPRYARRDHEEGREASASGLLHRICRGYAFAGLAVPVFGLVTGVLLGVLTQAWLIASIILTALAAVLLALGILRAQRRLLAGPAAGEELGPQVSRLHMLTGFFNLLWAVVVVLMVVRPGA